MRLGGLYHVAIEIGVALIGGGITFAAAGGVPALVTAWVGSFGKNRNPTVAALFALPSAIGAFLILMAAPQLLTLFVEPGGDDMSFSALVYLVAGTGWAQLAVWAVGFVVALIAAWLTAVDAVRSQKFCEPCDAYMDEVRIHGMSFDVARWAFTQITQNDAASVAAQLVRNAGVDVEPTLFDCPQCHRGFFEARAHFFSQWQEKNTEEMRDDWICFSQETSPDQTIHLAKCKRIDDAY